MSATKLDGTLYRDEIFSDLAQRVSALKEKGITPGLATVLVGEDPGSQSYVKMKHRDCLFRCIAEQHSVELVQRLS